MGFIFKKLFQRKEFWRKFALPAFVATFGATAAPSPAEHLEVAPKVAAKTKLTLWADSKLVKSPIAIDVDAQGRVWATEDEGALVVLSDSDNDGKADQPGCQP